MTAYRRRCVKLVCTLLLSLIQWSLASAAPLRTEAEIRLGVTPVILHNQIRNNEAFAAYLSRATGRRVAVIQRRTYREIIDLLKGDQLDFAWICGLPYVRNRHWLQNIAIPLNGFNDNRPLYRSLVIVANDSDAHALTDLKGGIFAFADPDSNSGHLVPRYLLQRMGTTPEDFFSTHMFTYSHRNVVRAVAEGLVDGGSVDSYVLQLLAIDEPELASRVRVVERSDEFAFPPVVARKRADAALVRKFRFALLHMAEDDAGRALLRSMHLGGFVDGRYEPYRAIARMDEQVFSVDRARMPVRDVAGVP